jgi:drug/metabolite transporter (DMT)-like permease
LSVGVAAAVLAAALFHATWNAILRVQGERLSGIGLIATASALIVLPLLPFLPLPAVASWGWLALSVAFHTGYNASLATAYNHGGLSRVYPLARGAAPPLTLAASLMFLPDTLGPLSVAGVCVLATGILVLAFEGGIGGLTKSPAAVGYALLTAVFIAGYTIADGQGARLAGSPHAYVAWLFLLEGLPLVGFLVIRRRAALVVAARRSWRPALLAGLLSLLAYWIVVWAMTRAPIALVAAVRETSVVFALVIGVVVLGETVSRIRVVAVLLVAAGLVLMRL